MKKIITFIMILATITTSFVDVQILNNKKATSNDNQKFQLQLVINNQTSDVNGSFMGLADGTVFWYYLDLKIDSTSYYVANFPKTSLLHTSVKGYDGATLPAEYPDLFWTNSGSSATIFTLNLDPNKTGIVINFTFGIFEICHYQNTYANNYLYNYWKIYSNTGYNGTKLIINSYGGWGSNTANWAFQFYKF